MIAQRSPARLNAFDADETVTVRASTSAASEANGTWPWGGWTSSAWISSLTTTRS